MNTDQMSPREQAVVDHLINKHLMYHADPQALAAASREEQLLGQQMKQELDEAGKLLQLTKDIEADTERTKSENRMMNTLLAQAKLNPLAGLGLDNLGWLNR